MEVVREILGLILVAVAVPVAAIVGTQLARLLKRQVERLDCDKKERVAWSAIGWVLDKFPGLTETEKYQKAMERVANVLPGLSKEDVDEAVHALWKAKKDELGLGKDEDSLDED